MVKVKAQAKIVALVVGFLFVCFLVLSLPLSLPLSQPRVCVLCFFLCQAAALESKTAENYARDPQLATRPPVTQFVVMEQRMAARLITLVNHRLQDLKKVVYGTGLLTPVRILWCVLPPPPPHPTQLDLTLVAM